MEILGIEKEEYVHIGLKTTVCCLTLSNGFEIVGSSACVDPAEFDTRIGREWARKAAVNKLEEFEGFLRQQKTSCGGGKGAVNHMER